MAEIGRRIFYDKATGNVLVDTGDKRGAVIPSTVENDIASYRVLEDRVRTSFDYIDLSYRQHAQSFAEATAYRVNPATKTLEFTFPGDPEEPSVFVPSLEDQLEALQAAWMYDSMMKDLAIDAANASQADLLYQLMMNGVL